MKVSTRHLCRGLLAITDARQSDDCCTDLQHTVSALHSEIMHNEGCAAADVYVLAQKVKDDKEDG